MYAYCVQTGKKTKLSIISTLAWTFGPAYSVCCVYQLAYSVLQFANPQVFDKKKIMLDVQYEYWSYWDYVTQPCDIRKMTMLLISNRFVKLGKPTFVSIPDCQLADWLCGVWRARLEGILLHIPHLSRHFYGDTLAGIKKSLTVTRTANKTNNRKTTFFAGCHVLSPIHRVPENKNCTDLGHLSKVGQTVQLWQEGHDW